MLEKDIENLISRYPEEFLTYQNLKLIGQQVKLGTYFADIIFQDSSNNKLIIEVKRGILSRDAVAQIMDYYGILNIQEKSSNIKLLIIANIIPKERVILLSQKLVGIEFIEVSPLKIIEVAKKYSYVFLDGYKPEVKFEYEKQTAEIDKGVFSGKTDVWIFQANPQRFDILNALADKEMEWGTWLVSRFKDKIKASDIGIVWMSGNDSGIYALAEVITNPDYMEEPEISKKILDV